MVLKFSIMSEDTSNSKPLDGFLLVIDESGKIIYVSESVLSHIGFSYLDLTGHSWFSLLHPDDQVYSRTHLREAVTNSSKMVKTSSEEVASSPAQAYRSSLTVRVVQGNRPRGDREVSTTVSVQSPDKERAGDSDQNSSCGSNSCFKLFHFSGVARALRGAQKEIDSWGGRNVVWVAVGRLVSQMESNGNSKTDSLTDISRPAKPSHFVIRHDFSGRITFVDERCEHFTGFLPEQLLNTSLYRYLPEDDLPCLLYQYEQLKEKCESIAVVYRFRTAFKKNTTDVFLNCRAYLALNPITFQMDQIVSLATALTDSEGQSEMQRQSDRLSPLIAAAEEKRQLQLNENLPSSDKRSPMRSPDSNTHPSSPSISATCPTSTESTQHSHDQVAMTDSHYSPSGKTSSPGQSDTVTDIRKTNNSSGVPTHGLAASDEQLLPDGSKLSSGSPELTNVALPVTTTPARSKKGDGHHAKLTKKEKDKLNERQLQDLLDQAMESEKLVRSQHAVNGFGTPIKHNGLSGPSAVDNLRQVSQTTPYQVPPSPNIGLSDAYFMGMSLSPEMDKHSFQFPDVTEEDFQPGGKWTVRFQFHDQLREKHRFLERNIQSQQQQLQQLHQKLVLLANEGANGHNANSHPQMPLHLQMQLQRPLQKVMELQARINGQKEQMLQQRALVDNALDQPHPPTPSLPTSAVSPAAAYKSHNAPPVVTAAPLNSFPNMTSVENGPTRSNGSTSHHRNLAGGIERRRSSGGSSNPPSFHSSSPMSNPMSNRSAGQEYDSIPVLSPPFVDMSCLNDEPPFLDTQSVALSRNSGTISASHSVYTSSTATTNPPWTTPQTTSPYLLNTDALFFQFAGDAESGSRNAAMSSGSMKGTHTGLEEMREQAELSPEDRDLLELESLLNFDNDQRERTNGRPKSQTGAPGVGNTLTGVNAKSPSSGSSLAVT